MRAIINEPTAAALYYANLHMGQDFVLRAFLAAGSGKPVPAPIIDATPQIRAPRAAAS